MWIELTEAKFLEQCAGPIASAIKTAALGTGQGEPLTATIAKVVQEVRGYVAACQENKLGEGATIPAELEADAIALIRFRALNRLPVGKALLTETMIGEKNDALAKFRDVAACKFRIEQPATVSEQVIAGPAAQVITKTTRQATRAKLAGL